MSVSESATPIVAGCPAVGGQTRQGGLALLGENWRAASRAVRASMRPLAPCGRANAGRGGDGVCAASERCCSSRVRIQAWTRSASGFETREGVDAWRRGDAVRRRWAGVARKIGCDARLTRGCACSGMRLHVRCRTRVRGCAAVRSRARRCVGWATISRPAVGAASERVGLASNGTAQSCRQASAITAATGAFVRIRILEVRRHQSNFYPTWNVDLQ